MAWAELEALSVKSELISWVVQVETFSLQVLFSFISLFIFFKIIFSIWNSPQFSRLQHFHFVQLVTFDDDHLLKVKLNSSTVSYILSEWHSRTRKLTKTKMIKALVVQRWCKDVEETTSEASLMKSTPTLWHSGPRPLSQKRKWYVPHVSESQPHI